MKKNLLLVLTFLFLTAWLSGCNTFRGAGQDVENAGASMQKTADHND